MLPSSLSWDLVPSWFPFVVNGKRKTPPELLNHGGLMGRPHNVKVKRREFSLQISTWRYSAEKQRYFRNNYHFNSSMHAHVYVHIHMCLYFGKLYYINQCSYQPNASTFSKGFHKHCTSWLTERRQILHKWII